MKLAFTSVNPLISRDFSKWTRRESNQSISKPKTLILKDYFTLRPFYKTTLLGFHNIIQSLGKITVVKEYENSDTTLNGMGQASNFNEYTIKEDGLYYISANLYGAKSATSRTMIGVQKNGIAITAEHNGSGYYGIEASHIYQCKVGDKISGRFYNENAQVNKTNNLLCQIARLK